MSEVGTPDAIAFHHWAVWFEQHGYLAPGCLFGTSLRHPVRLFESMFYWCRGRSCPRPESKTSCGFLECEVGGKLIEQYSMRGSQLSMESFLASYKEWPIGRNKMTRFLGGSSDPVREYRKELRQVPLITNETLEGRAYLARAMDRLRRMDFVFIVETLDENYKSFFGVDQTIQHANVNGDLEQFSALNRKRATAEEQSEIMRLYDLDIVLYEFALGLKKSAPPRSRVKTWAGEPFANGTGKYRVEKGRHNREVRCKTPERHSDSERGVERPFPVKHPIR